MLLLPGSPHRREVTNTMMLRDRLVLRMREMGEPLDYPRLVAEVLGIRGASPVLARRLVAQALVIEDGRDSWRRVGERICGAAPTSPGVYAFRDFEAAPLYVGKAVNLRRRLRSHFAPGRWRALKPAMARVAAAEWQEVGSELEALLREAEWIDRLQPAINVQVGPPSLGRRTIAGALRRDVIAVLPSIDPACAELVAARADGAVLIQRTPRSGATADRHIAPVWEFFQPPDDRRPTAIERSLAGLVFSWLARRGATTTRLDPHQWESLSVFRDRLDILLRDRQLFLERVVIV